MRAKTSSSGGRIFRVAIDRFPNMNLKGSCRVFPTRGREGRMMRQ